MKKLSAKIMTSEQLKMHTEKSFYQRYLVKLWILNNQLAQVIFNWIFIFSVNEYTPSFLLHIKSLAKHPNLKKYQMNSCVLLVRLFSLK